MLPPMAKGPRAAASAPIKAQDLGPLTDIEAVDQLVNVRKMEIVDVGCGDGTLARALAERGANVLGLEPDPVQAAKNRAQPPCPGVTLVEAGAQSIPLENGTADGVIFSRSLHHVPTKLMGRALCEARRVLKPKGFVVVLEPEIDSPYSQLMRPFHDESKERAAAKRALKRLMPKVFRRRREYTYTTSEVHSDFESFVARMAGATFNTIRRDWVDTPKVRRAFEAGRTNGAYEFEHRMRAHLLLTD